MINLKIRHIALIFIAFFLSANVAASHLTSLSSVDFIDAVFPSGGGSYTKSLTSGADDGWSVFGGSAGDIITVTFSASQGTSGAGAAYDGAVLYEMNDGIVSIGDFVSVTDFSIDRFGFGVDLVIQHMPFNPGPGGSYGFTSVQSQSVSFALASSGQYAIGVSCSDEVCVGGSSVTVALSGNTGSIPVPEPVTLMLLSLGLAGLGFTRMLQPINSGR